MNFPNANPFSFIIRKSKTTVNVWINHSPNKNSRFKIKNKRRSYHFMATSSADFMQMYLLNFPVPSSHTFSLSLLPNLYNEIRIKFLLYRGSEIGRHMVESSLLNVGDFSTIYTYFLWTYYLYTLLFSISSSDLTLWARGLCFERDKRKSWHIQVVNKYLRLREIDSMEKNPIEGNLFTSQFSKVDAFDSWSLLASKNQQNWRTIEIDITRLVVLNAWRHFQPIFIKSLVCGRGLCRQLVIYS